MIVTLLFARAEIMEEAATVVFAVPGSNKLPNVLPELVDDEIVTLAGSSSHSPDSIPPEVSAKPKTCKLFLLEVSTKPP